MACAPNWKGGRGREGRALGLPGMVIADPDGNEFYFPYEGLEAKGTLKKF
jgi:hypothetical protein